MKLTDEQMMALTRFFLLESCIPPMAECLEGRPEKLDELIKEMTVFLISLRDIGMKIGEDARKDNK